MLSASVERVATKLRDLLHGELRQKSSERSDTHHSIRIKIRWVLLRSTQPTP